MRQIQRCSGTRGPSHCCGFAPMSAAIRLLHPAIIAGCSNPVAPLVGAKRQRRQGPRVRQRAHSAHFQRSEHSALLYILPLHPLRGRCEVDFSISVSWSAQRGSVGRVCPTGGLAGPRDGRSGRPDRWAGRAKGRSVGRDRVGIGLERARVGRSGRTSQRHYSACMMQCKQPQMHYLLSQLMGTPD